MKNLLYLFICFLVIFTTACSDSTVDSSDGEIIRTGENFTFIESADKAAETDQNRSSGISDPFEIDDVRIEDKDDKRLMYIDVVQPLGCEDTYPEKFEVIWDGIMLMIYPPQVGFYLTFSSEGCEDLQENVEETIVLNLYEIFGDPAFVDSARFTVINASKSEADNDHQVNR